MKTFRNLTFAEKKVNFNKLDRYGRGLSSLLMKKVQPLIVKLARRQDNEKTKEALVNIVTIIQKEAFEVGKKSAATEMKVRVPPTNKNTVDAMKKGNEKVVARIVSDINESLTSHGFSEEGIVSKFVQGLKTLFVYGAINMGREVIYEKYPEKVYAFQYSAIMDGRTTELCASLDGLTVDPKDPRRKTLAPPNHWNCRSIWVEILQEEEYKPQLEDRAPEDNKNMMKKYKDNAVKVGIPELEKKIIKTEIIEVPKATVSKTSISKSAPISIQKSALLKSVSPAAKAAFEKEAAALKKQIGDSFINMGIRRSNNRLDANDVLALKIYSRVDFADVNSLLRNTLLFSSKKDKAAGIAYYVDKALGKLPNYTGTTVRGLNLSNANIKKTIENLKVGDSYVDDAFMSTTKGLTLADAFKKSDVKFVIQSKTGKSIEGYSTFGSDEKEVLFSPKTPFKITKITKGKQIIIEMEEQDSKRFSEEISAANQIGEEFDRQLLEIRKTYK